MLALGDKEAITEIMLLERLDRTLLLGLPQASLVQLAAVFDAAELRWLASYVAGMETRQSNLLVERLLRDPGLMAKLQNEPVRQAVLQSSNVEETIAFLSEETTTGATSPVETVGQVIEDTQRMMGGEVSWWLFWGKYGTWQTLLWVLGGLVLLFLVVRLLWRRGQPVNVIVNLPNQNRE